MKYQLRLMLRNENGGNNSRGKWHLVMESNVKGDLLSLAHNNPRLAVFELKEGKDYYTNIFQEGRVN